MTLKEYSFAKRGRNVTLSFFDKINKYQQNTGSWTGSSTVDQAQYLSQKEQQISNCAMSDGFQSIIPLASQTEAKIIETVENQRKLRNIQKDGSATLLFASSTKGGTEDKVQAYTTKIKDSISEIQREADEVEEGLKDRMPNKNFAACVKTTSEILSLRIFGIAREFKSSLQEHQKTIQKQEAKKERLIHGNMTRRGQPSNGKSSGNINFGGGGTQGTDQPRQLNNGLSRRQNIRQRVNIKPTKYPQASQDGISGQNLGFGAQAQAQQDPSQQNKTRAIQSIESTLHEISGLFKKFGTIVSQHELLVQRIDNNAEQAQHDIEGAKKHLREVYEDTSSNRQLILKIFFILLIFVTFYILFVL